MYREKSVRLIDGWMSSLQETMIITFPTVEVSQKPVFLTKDAYTRLIYPNLSFHMPHIWNIIRNDPRLIGSDDEDGEDERDISVDEIARLMFDSIEILLSISANPWDDNWR